MALTVVTSGTTSALVIGTETNLESARTTTLNDYIYEVDVGAIVSGDVLFLRIYKVLLASGTERLAWAGSFIGGVDGEGILQSIPMVMQAATGVTIRATLQQKAGTGRTFPWILYTL